MRVDAAWPTELPADYAIVGESPGETELIAGRPFVGPSGRLLDAALARAHISRSRCLVTNVFPGSLPPPKPRSGDAHGPFAAWLRLPYNPGAYLPLEMVPETLERLQAELVRAAPRYILALGQTAIWALLGPRVGRTRISQVVGNWYTCELIPGVPCLPCYHPAAVLRQPSLRLHFFRTVQKLNDGPGADPGPDIVVPTRPADIAAWAAALSPDTLLAIDIELYRRMIECVGFCDGGRALVVPFLNHGKPWWDSPEAEGAALRATAELLQHPCPKVLQNGQFDVSWLWNAWGVGVRNWCHDTRLMHHVWMPDVAKDLASQAAIHLNVEGWKHLGNEAKRDA